MESPLEPMQGPSRKLEYRITNNASGRDQMLVVTFSDDSRLAIDNLSDLCQIFKTIPLNDELETILAISSAITTHEHPYKIKGGQMLIVIGILIELGAIEGL